MILSRRALATAFFFGAAALLGTAAPTKADPYRGYFPPQWDHRWHEDHRPDAHNPRYTSQRGHGPDARIWRGWRDGRLTPDEARRLAQRERHLHNRTRKAWADGRLTPHEARHLGNLADRDRRAFWRLGHNGKGNGWQRYD